MSTYQMTSTNGSSAAQVGTDHKPILAARFKTKMCRNHVVHGFCPYEQRCMFAHGDDDMRTKEMNLADQLTTEDAIKAFQRAKFAAKARAAMMAVAEASAPLRKTMVQPSWDDIVTHKADGSSYRYAPYARWSPFFVESDSEPTSPEPVSSYSSSPVERPALEWTEYSCTCPACQGGVSAHSAPPKYVPEMGPRHKVLVP